jgi:hypothetical protein
MLLPVTAFLCTRNDRSPKSGDNKIEMKRFIKYLICVLSENYFSSPTSTQNTYFTKIYCVIGHDAVCNVIYLKKCPMNVSEIF